MRSDKITEQYERSLKVTVIFTVTTRNSSDFCQRLKHHLARITFTTDVCSMLETCVVIGYFPSHVVLYSLNYSEISAEHACDIGPRPHMNPFLKTPSRYFWYRYIAHHYSSNRLLRWQQMCRPISIRTFTRHLLTALVAGGVVQRWPVVAYELPRTWKY